MKNRPIRLIALLLVVCLFGQVLARGQNGAASLSLTSLNGLDGFIEQVMNDWKVPGLAVAIVKDGKVVHSKGYGLRDVKKETQSHARYTLRHRVVFKGIHGHSARAPC